MKQKSDKGFTLIEVLIALVIFAIGIIGIAKMQSHSIQGNTFSREFGEATNVATNTVERLLSLDAADSDLTIGSHPTASPNPYIVTIGGITYTPTWICATITLGSGTATRATVTVTWQEKGQARSINMEVVR